MLFCSINVVLENFLYMSFNFLPLGLKELPRHKVRIVEDADSWKFAVETKFLASSGVYMGEIRLLAFPIVVSGNNSCCLIIHLAGLR